MYLNRSSRGIGWYSVVTKDNKGNKLEKGEYLNFIFKKGAEPQDDVITGDLFLIDQYGAKRPVFPYVDEYNGNRQIKFRILDALAQPNPNAEFNQDFEKNMGGRASQSGQSIDIDPDSLPFY